MADSDNGSKPTHYKYRVDDQLRTTIQEFEEERKKFWRTRYEGADWDMQERMFGHAEKVADSLLSETDDLVAQQTFAEEPEQFKIERDSFVREISPYWRMDEFKRGFRERNERRLEQLAESTKSEFEGPTADYAPDENSLLRVVWERLCIFLAEDAVYNKLVIGANRILQLSKLVVDVKPKLATLRFLRHVSRCFIWGFDSECVILCRGAIDTAFSEAVSDGLCDKCALERTKDGRHPLANRITAALREGVIDKSIKCAAYKVNTPANEAVHRDPDTDKVADSLTMIRDTMLVIQHLAAKQAK